MSKQRIIQSLLCLGLVFIVYLVFIPRTYDVTAFKERKGTKYWHLKTGSNIGYFKIEAKGETKRSAIVYLHGGPGGKISDDVVTTLQPLSNLGHDIYFYDQIGSGHSERLDNINEYSVRRHKDDLVEIIERLGEEKVIIIAHSWGCLLAVNYLQDHHQKIERMVLSGPGPILPIDYKLLKEASPDSLNLVAPKYSNKEGNDKASNFRSKLIQKWAYWFGTKLASDQEVDNFFTYLNGELSKSTECAPTENKVYEGGGGYYTHIMTVKSFSEVDDERNKLRKLKTPILVIRGQCDNQKWGFAKEYLDLLPNSNLEIIENSGHDLIRGNKVRYYELIRNFCELP